MRSLTLSSAKLREWQKYRGWKIRILEELEHSGGMTTRDISDGIGYRAAYTKDRLCEMLRAGLVERVERWGWRITLDGVFLLTINNNNNNSATTAQQQRNNSATTAQQDLNKTAPVCFHLNTCHIKRLCSDKTYSLKNRVLCHGPARCIWDTRQPAPAAVEMKPMGVSCA